MLRMEKPQLRWELKYKQEIINHIYILETIICILIAIKFTVDLKV